MVELHSVPAPQLAPIGFLPQLPPAQSLGARQSASVEQVVLQRPSVPHWNGVQLAVAAPAQVPAPSHVPAVVNIEPVQPGDAQIVPAP